MENDLDYISQMVEDTFEGVKEESNVLEFKLSETREDSVEPEQLVFDFESFHGIYDSERKCLVLHNSNKSVEVPVNWGQFRFYDFTQDEMTVNIEKHEDVDLFLDVLSDFMNLNIDSLYMAKHSDEVIFKVNQAQVQSMAA
jgi:hypothetical protein